MAEIDLDIYFDGRGLEPEAFMDLVEAHTYDQYPFDVQTGWAEEKGMVSVTLQAATIADALAHADFERLLRQFETLDLRVASITVIPVLETA